MTNQKYKETCGECHFAYQPELLPSASWLKILNQLDDHFEEEIEANPDTIKTISDYLKTNGAENSSAKRSTKIMRSLGNQVPMRISDIPYIREKHHELDPAIFKRKSVGSLANYTACHITAEKGIYSAVITTRGLMVGLHSGTHSKIVVLAGILTIAIADAFSDALGIHVSKEAENKHTIKQIWAATISTFLAKFLFAMTFVVPVILFTLSTAIVISLIWGLSILSLLSYIIAKPQSEPPRKIVGEHLMIAIVVIGITHWVGDWLGKLNA